MINDSNSIVRFVSQISVDLDEDVASLLANDRDMVNVKSHDVSTSIPYIFVHLRTYWSVADVIQAAIRSDVKNWNSKSRRAS